MYDIIITCIVIIYCAGYYKSTKCKSMLAAKLMSRGQATIPKVLKTLQLSAGDFVRFEIEGDKVVLQKVTAPDLQYLQSLESTLAAEWESEEDKAAYDNL